MTRISATVIRRSHKRNVESLHLKVHTRIDEIGALVKQMYAVDANFQKCFDKLYDWWIEFDDVCGNFLIEEKDERKKEEI